MLTILSKIDYNLYLDVYPFTLTQVNDNINSSTHTHILRQRCLSYHVSANKVHFKERRGAVMIVIVW